MIKYSIFMGCKIPFYLEHYGTAVLAVLKALDVETVENEYNCCGYPNRDLHFESFIFSSVRNIALAEKSGLNIVTPCKCCFGSLKHGDYWMKENESLRNEINVELAKEGLKWTGKTQVKHFLSVLMDDVGLDKIKSRVKFPQKNLKVAAHYGCHALRPGNIVQFDNPLAPTIFEKLIEVTGAENIEWPRRLDCCGNPLLEKNREISLKLMRNKILDASECGAEYLCTACTYCQLQFDTIQKIEFNEHDLMPSILYAQLLGLSLGLPKDILGIEKNNIPLKLV